MLFRSVSQSRYFGRDWVARGLGSAAGTFNQYADTAPGKDSTAFGRMVRSEASGRVTPMDLLNAASVVPGLGGAVGKGLSTSFRLAKYMVEEAPKARFAAMGVGDVGGFLDDSFKYIEDLTPEERLASARQTLLSEADPEQTAFEIITSGHIDDPIEQTAKNGYVTLPEYQAQAYRQRMIAGDDVTEQYAFEAINDISTLGEEALKESKFRFEPITHDEALSSNITRGRNYATASVVKDAKTGEWLVS